MVEGHEDAREREGATDGREVAIAYAKYAVLCVGTAILMCGDGLRAIAFRVIGAVAPEFDR